MGSKSWQMRFKVGRKPNFVVTVSAETAWTARKLAMTAIRKRTKNRTFEVLAGPEVVNHRP